MAKTKSDTDVTLLKRAPTLDPLRTCFELLCRDFHIHMPPEAFAHDVPEGEKLSTGALVRIASRHALFAQAVPCHLNHISPLALPCILLMKNRHAVVLDALEGQQAVVRVPEAPHQPRTLTRDALMREYVGSVVYVSPVQAEHEAEQTSLWGERHWFWGALVRAWPIYAQVVAAAVFINLLALATPLFVMNVYDRVVPNQAVETLWVLAIGVLLAFVFEFSLKSLRSYFIDVAGKAADIEISSHIFRHMLDLKMSRRPSSAGMFANTMREFESLREFFTSASLATIIDLPFLLIFVMIIYMIGGPVGTVALVAIPLALIGSLVMQMPLHGLVLRNLQEGAKKHAILVESLLGFEVAKVSRAKEWLQLRWEKSAYFSSRMGTMSRLVQSLAVNFATFMSQVSVVLVVVWGVYLIKENVMSVGALVACTILTGRALAPLASMAGLFSRYHQAKEALANLNTFMHAPVEHPKESQFLQHDAVKGDVVFRDVVFRYPQSKMQALRDVSLTIRPGEKIGLVGPTGSGKSSLLKLLLNLYQPQSGVVLMDGIELSQFSPEALRRSIGYMPQDPFLFHGSVRDNVTLGDMQVSSQMVWDALRFTGVDVFTNAHPQGVDMPVGEGGQALSGGQRQQVALARALLLQPPILALDEPTSAMDTAREKEFSAALKAFANERTLLLSTHRLALLDVVDRLIVLEGGRVVADGPKSRILDKLNREGGIG